AACVADVDGATGRAAVAYDRLSRALAASRETDPSQRGWVLTLLAELAARQGLAAVAEGRYRSALAEGAPDGYLLGSYAALLLAAGRAAEVLPLLAGHTAADNLLLRLAEAEAEVGAPDATAHRDELRARYAASRARGDRIHLREEARFQLHLEHDARA